jgi:hypothetical protein
MLRCLNFRAVAEKFLVRESRSGGKRWQQRWGLAVSPMKPMIDDS